MQKDSLKLGKFEFQSRFILGSGKYSLELIDAAIRQAGAQIITLALRRVNSGGMGNILDFIPEGVTLLPNTSGARRAEEALRIALLARELCGAELIKIEVIRDSKYLLPDNYETARAVELLAKEGFTPLPYMSADIYAARAMRDAGAAALMPLAAPIGSNRGLCAREFIEILLAEFDLPIIVDAGLGTPAQACEAMQMGAAGVMVNTALAEASNTPQMARAFALAVEAGRAAFLAGLAPVGGARASSPLTGFLRD
ncbi:thiazole synthase [Campylobacter sp.]|uniref:thiazole synthase n=1 Tax=Campylobacter sp. TaxID=205 RepID=UPI0026DC50C2|nr:thiazole synthase [Campylobacter sp.]MDO4674341.1 thiazole synthase [Campylobacter sp.]